jgi:uncharacterized membrane protein
MTSQGSEIKKPHFKELDVLRGLAAIMMVINHVGAALLSGHAATSGVSGALFFIGSFAPVIFFFVTGLGAGIQSSNHRPSGRWADIWIKVGILFVADLLMHWEHGRTFGLDFLGFIGLSVLVLEFVRTSKFPLTVCIFGIIAASMLRYVVSPFLRSLEITTQWAPLNWLIGQGFIQGVGYPFSPWMTYPLLGFVLGVLLMRHHIWLRTHLTKTLLGLALFSAVLTAVSLYIAKSSPEAFFRWGNMAIGFYIASFAVIALGLAIVLVSCNVKGLELTYAPLALRGIASLAVVPIHHFLINLISQGQDKTSSLLTYCVTTFIIIGITFFSARWVEIAAQKAAKLKQQRTLWFGLVAVVAVFATAIPLLGSDTLLAGLAAALGQLALCILFLVRHPFQPSCAVAMKA